MPLGERRDFRGVVDLTTMSKLEWRTISDLQLFNESPGMGKTDGANYLVSPVCSQLMKSVN